jgi:hypothetical protein
MSTVYQRVHSFSGQRKRSPCTALALVGCPTHTLDQSVLCHLISVRMAALASVSAVVVLPSPW